MAAPGHWTGYEARLLRTALRLSLRAFAAHLGVGERTVSKWEKAGRSTTPWPETQAILDTALARASEDARARFAQLVETGPAVAKDRPATPLIGDLVTGIAELERAMASFGLTFSSGIASPSNRRPAPDYTAAVAFSGDGMRASVSSVLATSWATAIYDAVLNPVDAARRIEGHAEGGAADPRILRPAVNRAMYVSLSSDYSVLEHSLPGLIGLAEIATMRADGDDRAAHLALSDVYAVVGWTLIKADNSTGAFIAAQRALQAAEHADDVLRVAAATRCLAEVHMRAANFEAATRLAFLAAVHLESASPEDRLTAISIRGAALLSAAAASARRGDRREAQAALKAAVACAGELGQDRAGLATVFGPTNVAIHRVAIAIELGDAHEAARHIPAVQLDQMPPTLTERRARFLIDVARSYTQMKDDDAAIDALIQAEAIAPDELRHHRLTRDLIPQLLTREHRSSDLRALAGRCHLLA